MINEGGERLINFLGVGKCIARIQQKTMDIGKCKFDYKNEVDYIQVNQKYNVKDISFLNHFKIGGNCMLIRVKMKIDFKLNRQKLIRNQLFPAEEPIQHSNYQVELKTRLSRQ